MSKLSFGEVMLETYPAIASQDGQDAFLEYRAKIKELDAKDRLTESHVLELVDEDSLVQKRLGGAVEEALGSGIRIGQTPLRIEGRSFKPGASVIVSESGGKVRGIYHRPNQDEILLSYGNGLLWAAMKLGDESYAFAHGASTADPLDNRGYNAVCKALTGKDLQDVPFKDRPHLGGASLDLRKRPGHGNQGPLLHAGVSGVLLTNQALRAVINEDSALKLMHWHAQAEQADDGFAGNIFAGSIDSKIGNLVLSYVTNTWHTRDVDLDVTVAQFSNGVNVH